MLTLKQIFGINESAPSRTSSQETSPQQQTDLLGLITNIKAELQKIDKGGTSSIPELNQLKGPLLKDAIVLTDFAANSILRKPIDDTRLEFERITTLIYNIPSNHPFFPVISKIVVSGLWRQLPHPGISFHNPVGYQWRSPDGYNNNITYPNVGRAGEKYSRNFNGKRPRSTALPDPGLIFDKLLSRCPNKDGKFKGNPSFVSSNLFYFATLITHDLFNTDPKDLSINLTTSYVDLSPLYGWTKELQDSIRTGVNGLIKPDQHADNRFWIHPAGVTAILVLFSRNHNFLAAQLLNIDENGRFSSLDDQQRDEALFQTARLINERTYVNIISHDYLRVIHGVNRARKSWNLNIRQDYTSVGNDGDIPTGTGNQCSLEFNFLYRWHHGTSAEDEKWIENEFRRRVGDWENMDMNTMFEKLAISKQNDRNHSLLIRQENGRYADEDLARAIIYGCKNVSGAFGGRNTPRVLRNVEISGIIQARSMGICTLNEYRNFLSLKKYESFKDLNPELADEIAKLYPTIDDVELYPGLLCEKAKPPVDGSGLCFNYTTSTAIIADAVAVIRSDRFHCKEVTPYNLTNFGMEDTRFDENSHFGTFIGRKLIGRHLSSVFKENSVYALFPFTVPTETMKNLGDKQSAYDFTDPL